MATHAMPMMHALAAFAPLALALVASELNSSVAAAPSWLPPSPPPPPSAAGALKDALNAADFGAVGDCHHNATTPVWSTCRDMAPALQRAIDAAQKQRKALFIPAGRYALNASLVVRSNQNKSELVPGPDGEDYVYGPLRMFGEGRRQTILQAGSQMLAVLDFPLAGVSPATPAGLPHTEISIEHLSLSAGRLADYCIHAPGITRSKFQSIAAESALKVGIRLGYGWILAIEDSIISDNVWPAGAIYVTNSANNIDIVNNMLEGNGWGIALWDGMNINIAGNCIEGTGGPAVIGGGTSALKITANYFESNNAKGFGGPMVLQPPPNAKELGNITIQADIVLNGASDLYSHPWPIANTYGNTYPMNNVLISGNYHSNDKSPDPSMPWSAVLVIAALGVTIEAEVCGQPGGAGHKNGPEGPTGCGNDAFGQNPLVVTGVDDRAWTARDVRVSGGTGWSSEQGFVALYGAATDGLPEPPPGPPAQAAGRMGLHSWVTDGPWTATVNLINTSGLHGAAPPTAVPGLGLPVPLVTTEPELDGHAVTTLTLPAGAHEAALELAAIPLRAWPSLRGRALWAALDIQPLTAQTGAALLLDRGDGVWRHSSRNYEDPIANWSRTSFQCVAAHNGTVRLALHVFTEAARSAQVRVGSGAMGVVGSSWQRLVPLSPLGLL